MPRKPIVQNMDLMGRKFGRLTVVEYCGQNKYKRPTWRCLCKCGNSVIIPSHNLIYDNTKSCGCLQKEAAVRNGIKNRKAQGHNGCNALYYNYRATARRRNLKFSLDYNQFQKITQQPCYYCDKEPAQVIKTRSSPWGTYIYNGIDRVDGNMGYTIDNCVACCGDCNAKKKAITKSMIKKAYVFLLRNGAYDE